MSRCPVRVPFKVMVKVKVKGEEAKGGGTSTD